MSKIPSTTTALILCGALWTACADDPLLSVDDVGTQASGTQTGDGEGDGDGADDDVCGDGVVEGIEECDDGNPTDTDACTNICMAAACGDGLIHSGVEECDAGPDNGPGNPCTSMCTVNVCGDGELGPGEGCDDGDENGPGNPCTDDCMLISCGDGVVGIDEQCDDANTNEFDSCTTLCMDFVEPVLQLSLSQIKQFEFSWAPVFGAEYYQLLESADTGAPFVQVGADVIGQASSLTVPLHFRLNASHKLRACRDDEGCTESAVVETVGSLAEAVGYFKASNAEANDLFGHVVALSGDGSTMAVNAYTEDSNAVGINGNQSDNSTSAAGAVYVFVRDEQNAWSQQAYVKASSPGADDTFGSSVALSEDGSTLAVGAQGEDSNATGIDGNQADNSVTDSGAAYVFVRNGQGVWSQQAYVKASNTGIGDLFGSRVALSGDDGSTLVVGAFSEDSGGNQADNSSNDAGAVYVFVRDGQNAWSQQAYVKASNPGEADYFGVAIALSGDGNTLAVGAGREDSSANGIGGDQTNNSVSEAGATYVFVRNGQGAWSQQVYIKASNTGVDDRFGYNVALNGDGSTLAVGAFHEDSNATDIGGNQADNSFNDAGAVYVYVRNGQGAWSQEAYVKASNPGASDEFGLGVALSEDGNTLAVGARKEDSSSTGIGGNQADNSTADAGSVYVFVRDGQNAWSQRAYIKASNTGAGDIFGEGVALSDDGYTLVVVAEAEDSSAMGIGGDQMDDSAPNAGAVYVY